MPTLEAIPLVFEVGEKIKQHITVITELGTTWKHSLQQYFLVPQTKHKKLRTCVDRFVLLIVQLTVLKHYIDLITYSIENNDKNHT